ncbi:MAG: amino acid racemase [Candidatus Staskawiczbacteria bacterium]|nr:amino acid racemase [Candidatus Staskawiczbacteria bacterium]
MKTVGIIGGLGPETTSEFYLDIVFSCQKLEKTARPAIIISSVPLPYQIEEDAISKNIGIERCLPFLIKEAKRLEKSGADFIVMPCNSLHVFIEDIRKSVKVPVLSIVEETVKFLKQENMKKVGIVSTSATIKNKLYENAFAENGIAYVAPDDFSQAKMGKFILNLVTGQQKNQDREELIKIINEFEGKNVDCVILACTDLQLLIPSHPNLKTYDTMKILSNATVREVVKN